MSPEILAAKNIAEELKREIAFELKTKFNEAGYTDIIIQNVMPGRDSGGTVMLAGKEARKENTMNLITIIKCILANRFGNGFMRTYHIPNGIQLSIAPERNQAGLRYKITAIQPSTHRR